MFLVNTYIPCCTFINVTSFLLPDVSIIFNWNIFIVYVGLILDSFSFFHCPPHHHCSSILVGSWILIWRINLRIDINPADGWTAVRIARTLKVGRWPEHRSTKSNTNGWYWFRYCHYPLLYIHTTDKTETLEIFLRYSFESLQTSWII